MAMLATAEYPEGSCPECGAPLQTIKGRRKVCINEKCGCDYVECLWCGYLNEYEPDYITCEECGTLTCSDCGGEVTPETVYTDTDNDRLTYVATPARCQDCG